MKDKINSGLIPQGLILDEISLRNAVDYFLSQEAFSFDVEAQGDYRGVPHLSDVIWISLATSGCGIVIPFGHPIGSSVIGKKTVLETYKTGNKKGQVYNKKVDAYEEPPDQLSREQVFSILSPLFSNDTILKIGHDVIYDLVSVSKYLGFVPSPPYHCTKTASWILNENNRRDTWLKEMIEDTYDFTYDDENIGKCVESHGFSKVAYYSYCDSKWDWIIYNNQEKSIDEQGLRNIFDLEMNVLNVLIGMRLSGVRVDVSRLKELREELKTKLTETEGRIYSSAGKKFNLNSPKQKQVILFGPESEGNQGLKPWKLTGSGKKAKKENQVLTINHYSTDDDVLASYPDNPVTVALREYGDIDKILGTYVESWLGSEEEIPKIFDGKIHAGLQQYGTVTGRFSCRAPNLQNLPRASSELGKMVRDVFIAEPGGKLIVADYSQIELVILAHYIGEGKLYEAFMQGIDPHTMTAAMVLNKKPFISEIEGDGGITKIERQDLGKAQPMDVKILTPNGWTTMGEIQRGHIVCTPDGSFAKVTGVYPQGVRPVYRVTFSDHTFTECDENHLWQVETRHSTKKLLTTKEMIDSGLTYKALSRGHAYSKYSVKLTEPIKFKQSGELPIDSYLLGLLLGDGCFRHPDNVSISSADDFIYYEVISRIPEGHSLKHKNPKAIATRAAGYDYTIRSGTVGNGNMGRLKRDLVNLGLFGKNSHNKFIPEGYLLSSIKDRTELLRGLMDTDGHCLKNAGTNEFSTVSEQLANDVAFLVRSIGGKVTKTKTKSNWTYKGVKKQGTVYRLQIWTPVNPFKLPRKADLHELTKNKAERRTIKSIEFVGYKETQCIMLDSDEHLYITDDFIPTHNTLGFAVVYGAGIGKVSSMANITFNEAKKILRKHEQMFPEIHGFKQDVINLARSRNPCYITTLLGRKRRIPELLSSSEEVKMGAERQTFNSLIQGGAADLMKLALVRLDASLPAESKIVMTVHDEVMVTAPDNMVEETMNLVKEAMIGEGIQKLVRVPMKIEINAARRWSDAK